ncbi:FecR domain-containing protein, partial [Magnetococcales bacterium HHB-1]
MVRFFWKKYRLLFRICAVFAILLLAPYIQASVSNKSPAPAAQETASPPSDPDSFVGEPPGKMPFDDGLGSALLLGATALKEMHLGRLTSFVGKVEGWTPSQEPKTFNINEEVYPYQFIRTGSNSSAVITFRDGSTFSLGSDSEVILDHYVFNPAASVINNKVSIEKGAFRYRSGFMVKKTTVAIKTPTAILGLRGTTVEGVISGVTPNFINLPKGEGVFNNQFGDSPISQGQAVAIPDENAPPSNPDKMPAPVTLEVIQFVDGELSEGETKPLTLEQIKKDALLNLISVVDQNAIMEMMRSKSNQFDQESNPPPSSLFSFARKSPIPITPSLPEYPRFQAAYNFFDRIFSSFSLVSNAVAATEDEIRLKLKYLIAASKFGFTNPSNKEPSEEEKQAQREFVAKVKKANPNAAKRLIESNKKQIKLNNKKIENETGNVISGVAKVATSPLELAMVASQTVVLTKGADMDMTETVVESALSSEGTTEDTAAQVVGAIASADPENAGKTAVTAVNALPPDQQKKSAALLATTAAKVAPEQSASIGAALIKNSSAEEDDELMVMAASLAQSVGGEYAAEIAAEMAKALPPEKASKIAAAVAKVAPPEKAADIVKAVVSSQDKKKGKLSNETIASVAAAVTGSLDKESSGAQLGAIAKAAVEASGGKGAAVVAAVLTKQAGKESAAVIAQSVVEAAPKKAAQVASIVTSIAGVEAAESVAKSVITATKGESAASVVSSVLMTTKGEMAVEVAQAVADFVGEEKAPDVAAAAIKASGDDKAAEIASAVTLSAGTDAAAKIAAASAKVASPEKAAEIAKKVSATVGPEAAP